ncbi:MAG: ferrous iron transport protein B [Planctomycetota bacterium]|nr:ferrous iron transport protein B [Planctomycetota bacterium]
MAARPVIALAGNPNSGKTSLFNALTGLRRKVGNYPGITVDRVEGAVTLRDGREARVVDLPGCYSLLPRSEDERLARGVLIGTDARVPRPDVVVAVVDASSLERNLYFLTQLLDMRVPVVVALNMIDVAASRGLNVDAAALEAKLGVPVVPVIGRTGENTDALLEALDRAKAPGRLWSLSAAGEEALAQVHAAVQSAGTVPADASEAEAVRLLVHGDDPAALGGAVGRAQDALVEAGVDRLALEAECRYAFCREAARAARADAPPKGPTRSERIDGVFTHRVLGPLLFLGIMALMFMSVFAWAEPFMGWIEEGTGWVQEAVGGLLGEGILHDLVVDGIIAGVGNVVIFLPQICILFLFLAILEDLGYMARAAFLIDRLMRVAGLSGKAFVPLMSSFACAIPGIMAARTIESRRDRLVTILVAPLMSCSARLPVYVLLIGAFIPAGYQGLTLLSMYMLSVVAAIGVAWLLRRTMFKGEGAAFLLELPPYRLPSFKGVLRTVATKGWVFVREAGTVILAISILLWFLAYFPKDDAISEQASQRIEAGEDAEEVAQWEAGAQLEQSFAGRLGHGIEPVIEPLGYDWKTGVGLIASFAAREVMVSTLGIVYSVGEADEESVPLRERMKADKRPDGSPVHTPLTSISLMVFFVLACQCMSTLAVVKRETNSWRWPLFMVVYMTVLAYVASLIVYQGGLALGYGP